MAKYGGLTLTIAGRNLLAKALTGVELKFTRVLCGDGYLSADQVIADLTAMVAPQRELPINSMTVTGVGTATIRAIVANDGLTSGFWVREVGLFAEDPDDGEVLYAYANAGDYADYLPGQDGPDAVQFQLSLIAVIDQAAHVTAVISTDLTFVTQDELQYRLDDLFGKAAPIVDFWTRAAGDDKKFRPASKETVAEYFGLPDYSAMFRRIDVLEDILAQALLAMELKEIFPEYTHWIVEDFRVPNKVDLFSCRVVTVVSGSTSIDCEQIQGLVPGCHYTLTDGRSHEIVAVLSINVENDVNRLVTATPIQHSYRKGRALLVRTSALITADGAEGVQPPKVVTWTPNTVWRGVFADDVFIVSIDATLGNAAAFTVTGDVQITSDGFVTLGVE